MEPLPLPSIATTIASETINIMADFFNGPYAWLRKMDNEWGGVGPNIADAVGGFPEEFGVSKALQEQFAEWAVEFENRCDDKDFDWFRWNWRGIELSKFLKREVGDRYNIVYHQPHEDPRFINAMFLII